MSMDLDNHIDPEIFKHFGVPDFLVEIIDEIVGAAWQEGHEAGQGDCWCGD